MLYIPKIGGILKILTDNAVKDLVVINFGEYFKSAGAKLYSKLSEEQFLRKVAESFSLSRPKICWADASKFYWSLRTSLYQDFESFWSRIATD